MLKKTLLLSLLFAVSIILAAFLCFGNDSNQPIAGPYLITAPHIPKNLEFAAEPVPLNNQEVLERLDRELVSNVYFHSQTILNIKKAQKYFPLIEKILQENGVPDDFKYLCVIESNLSNLVSPAGAAGYWQFLAPTGKSFGLEITSEVDERYNLEKSTKAACQYLKEAYTRFNSWTWAAASYNMGQAGLSGKMYSQKENNYYNLLLVEETQRYLFRILAVKLIFQKPETYGFHILKQEKYNWPKYKTIAINNNINNLTIFAKENNISYKDLKYLNPWLRDTILRNPYNKSYEIKILIK